jgi:tRNA(His) 5'-end guanylyltransferase
MDKTTLGDRMKLNYEKRYEYKLLRRTPVIIRLDGRSFHSIKCEKPFDNYLSDCIEGTARYLCKNIQGAKCAYTQSDEISILLIDYDTISTQAWFDYDLQKIVSISASMASVHFAALYEREIQFDSRAFNIPKEEVANYFIWRQKDWIRNSVQMLAQANFSHKQLQCKGQTDMHEMLRGKGVNWNDIPNRYKNGVYIFKTEFSGFVSSEDVIFTEDKALVEMHLNPSK